MACRLSGAKPLSETLLHHCQWIHRNKLQSNCNQNSNIFIQEIIYENVVWEMSAIFLRLQYVKGPKLDHLFGCRWPSTYSCTRPPAATVLSENLWFSPSFIWSYQKFRMRFRINLALNIEYSSWEITVQFIAGKLSPLMYFAADIYGPFMVVCASYLQNHAWGKPYMTPKRMTLFHKLTAGNNILPWTIVQCAKYIEIFVSCTLVSRWLSKIHTHPRQKERAKNEFSLCAFACLILATSGKFY